MSGGGRGSGGAAGRGQSNYQRQLKGGKSGHTSKLQGQTVRSYGKLESSDRLRLRLEGDDIDSKFGFDRVKDGPPRLGWLLNFMPITMADEAGMEKSGLDLYFLDKEGQNFKASIFFAPYFFLVVNDPRRLNEVAQYLTKKYESGKTELVKKEDLEMANHLSGKQNQMIKISFGTVSELQEVRQALRPIIQANAKRNLATDDYYMDDEGSSSGTTNAQGMKASDDPLVHVLEMREHDVPYHMRASIDLELRTGGWHVVTLIPNSPVCDVVLQKDMLELCQPSVFAFDIECEKSPLKFPNAEVDRIYMISYMVSGQGYLLINREIVSADVDDFEYTQLPQFPGPFKVVNLADEEAMLKYFLGHIIELRPHVMVTYNGDFFDWPYVDKRCQKFNLDLYKQIGIKSTAGGGDVGEGEYTGRCMVHLDAFCWVKRDSYLPQGNQGLKAVTRYKLGYDPIEVDPEDMVRLAMERPDHMAAYSVSDAVATYYLYTTYVHNFIFSMSTIIPLTPEEVLRKGSGTLCEALLMVEAFRGNIICPNKQTDPITSFHEGHLLDTETYIGGHVECLEAGVFRADFPAKFTLVPSAIQGLIKNIDRDLTFALETENGVQRSDIENYDEVRQAIVARLEMLRDSPIREENPAIYHIDVGAMYPNIILTNRLQPAAMVSQNDCAACDFNSEENRCQRKMKWTWRGEYSPANLSEYNMHRRQLEVMSFPNDYGERVNFNLLSEAKQAKLMKERLKGYSQRVYKKNKITKVEERIDTVCQRENPFYVNTVRAFRDRRYEYKLLTKQWKGKKAEAEKKGDPIGRKVASDKEVLMDSLQLAHKCILNSFYGYVMRKGARWRSMEMAGIVTHTGAHLIMQARELVEQLGRPLELDTDGIWCILPSSFPQEFHMRTKNGKKVNIDYPCAMLNADVHERYTNHQYQDLAPGSTKSRYNSKSECSIYFELDGPYKAMVLPASPEEGKLLKKKYVVYNFDGSIAELKGFEVKRRGELELIKIFQTQVFDSFLAGDSLGDCYNSVGSVGNEWLDILDSKGININDEELMGYISEKKTISKTVEDYDGKSTSLTTAARLADFLGPEMVKDKGLNCNLIISRLPAGSPTTERAIPVAIFSAEPSVKRYFLRKWLKDPTLDVEDFREVVDWEYYKERIGKSIQKIISIPAGIQRVPNPCPRIEHPVWLQRQMNDQLTGLKQTTMLTMFAKQTKAPKPLAESHMVTGMPPPTGRLSMRDQSPSKRLPGSATKGAGGTPLLGHSPSPVRSSPGRFVSPSRRTDSEIGKRKGQNLFGGSPSRSLVDGSPSKVTGDGPIADMEDMFNRGSPGGPGRPIAHFSRPSKGTPDHSEAETAPAAEEVVVAVPIIRDGVPETEAEMQAWIAARSKSWRAKRKEKKAERIADGRSTYAASMANNDAGMRKKPQGVADLVRSAALSASYGYWQIIELQETDAPGEFVVWAMTGRTQLQRLRVVIPRTVYTNVHTSKAAAAARAMGGHAVQRDLPHARPGGKAGLFEITVPEHKWVANDASMANFMSDPACEGTYESQVPLWLRGVLTLGCVARVNKAAGAGAPTNKAYKLSDLELVSSVAHPYLTEQTSQYRRIFLYMCQNQVQSRKQAAVGLFIVDNKNEEETNETLMSGRSYVWIVETGMTYNRPSMQRLYRKFQPDERADVNFTTLFVPTLAEAMQGASERLDSYLRERNGPTVVVAQGALTPRLWRKNCPALREMPLLAMAANTQDSEFPFFWQSYVAQRMIQRFLIFPRWFNDRLQSARFAGIPLCNLGTDAPTAIIDVAFSRQLQHNRHLLWASSDPLPDIGGSESDLQSVWSEQLTEPVISNVGTYRNVCVELDLFDLAVCAIMSSGVLDAQGLTAITTNKGGGGNPEEEGAETGGTGGAAIFSDSSCARAFHLLKALVTKWIDDVIREGEHSISYGILLALYRYLCGFGDALLYDPALHRVVHGLMTKLFRRLVGEIQKLGAQIIYADFSRIIIHTSKNDLKSATEYVTYLVNAIRSKDTFFYINLTPSKFYEQMIWMGPENFGAILLNEETEAEKGVEYKKYRAQLGGESDDEDEENPDEQADDSDPFYSTHDTPVKAGRGNHAGDAVSESKKHTPDTGTIRGPILGSSRKKNVGFAEAVDLYTGEDDDFNAYSDDEDNPVRARATGKGGTDGEEEGRELDFLFRNDGEGGDSDEDAMEQEEAEEGKNSEHIPNEVEFPGQVQNWNLASYLPSVKEPPFEVAVLFKHVISEYMLAYKKKYLQLRVRRDMFLENAEVAHIGPGSGEEELAERREYDGPIDDEGLRESTLEHMRGLLQRGFTSIMLKYVDEILRHFTKSDQNSYFPINAGSHLHFSSAALEFVKATLHVLGLDTAMAEEVNNLRRLLLAHLKVQEFHAESRFVDPALSFVLSDIICSWCHWCRDVDLLRDPSVVCRDVAERWHCQQCNNQLDKEEVESRLMDKVERLAASYLLQDARCSSTRAVSTRLTTFMSELSKPLYLDTPPDKFREQLGILMRVAEFHQFELLKTTILQLL